MKKKIRDDYLLVFYVVFSIGCGLGSLLLSENKTIVLEIWYVISSIVWIFLIVSMLRYLKVRRE